MSETKQFNPATDERDTIKRLFENGFEALVELQSHCNILVQRLAVERAALAPARRQRDMLLDTLKRMKRGEWPIGVEETASTRALREVAASAIESCKELGKH